MVIPNSRLRNPISTTEREPADANAPDVAEPHRESMRFERPGHLSGCEAGLGAGRLTRDINIKVVQRAEVDEQTVARAMSCGVVSSAPDEQRETRTPRRIDHYRYVVDV